MSYNYSGNRLSSIVKGGTTYSYNYDSNGNTTTDGLRAMTLTYNQLNLPKSVTKGTDNLEYVYDARGNKHAIKVNGTVDKYYTGEIVYTNGRAVDYILTPEGMARPTGGTYTYQYNLTDHLGSVRAVVNQNGTVEQATDYYPFGMAFSTNNLTKNNYLYNNKELQDKTLGGTFFGMYDYGARYYDPVIGRWGSPDPLAEKWRRKSPYNYAANNPIRFIDPDGNDIWDFLRGVGTGMVNGVVSTAKELTQMADPSLLSPFKIGIAAAIANPGQTYNNIKENVLNTIQEVKNDKTGEKAGELTGNIIAQVGLAVAGTKGLDKLAKVGSVSEVANVAKAAQTTALVTKYPTNATIAGTAERTFLMPGQLIDRYGASGGKWFSTSGTSYGARSIPPGLSPYTQFKVLKPFEVEKSLASPGMFGGQTGFGIQFQSPVGADILIKRGIIAPF